MSSEKYKVLIIAGTVRKERVGLKLAQWYLAEAKKLSSNMEFEILDVAELNLPIFEEAMPPLYHQYSQIQDKVAKKIADADGFIFVTGEYNHTIPGSLKNFLDYVYAEWNYKAAAFFGYGGSGAIRAIEHLIQTLNFMRVATISDHLTVHSVWEALDEQGGIKSGYLIGDISQQLRELEQWIGATNTIRQSQLATAN